MADAWPCKIIHGHLELRQFKNDSMESKCMLVLKMPHFFPHCTCKWKSAAISKQTYWLTPLSCFLHWLSSSCHGKKSAGETRKTTWLAPKSTLLDETLTWEKIPSNTIFSQVKCSSNKVLSHDFSQHYSHFSTLRYKTSPFTVLLGMSMANPQQRTSAPG